MNKLKFDSYTLKEFIKEIRGDKPGYIKVFDNDPIYFNEVICDICNVEITQDENDLNKKVVFVLDTYALCQDCIKETIKNNEK